jgi:glycosyltransferase involved in cell wall biosynthesis
MSLSTPFLSIIIPAFNEESRLPATLESVSSFLQRQNYAAEVLIVENGSRDGTLRIAQEYARAYPQFRAIHVSERGKGRAVQRGMLEARGQFRFMCDADLSMPVDQIPRFLPPQMEGYEVVIASREAPGAVRYNEPFYRHFGGRLINWMIRLLALPGLQDTQCGFKCFQAAAAEILFQRLTLTGWSFDVEVLYIARQMGMRIAELPIPWYFNPESKLNLIQDTFKMVTDLLAMRRNARQGLYDAPRFSGAARPVPEKHSNRTR